jgi:hypothetical protein
MRAVAGSDVLLAVSQTLQNRLTAGLSALGPPVPVAELHDLNGPPSTNPPRATLFLYDVVEEPTSRNRRLVTRKRPLGLCLYYLVTAWAGDPVTEQQILGRVVQVFHEDAVIDGADLAGELGGTGVELRISLSRMQIDDRARIWWAINKPYRLSVNYEVRVVDVDADVTRSTTPVVSRRVVVGAES